MSHSHRLRAHTLNYLHSISNKVKPPRPSTQLQSHPWTILAQCSLDNCRPMAGSKATMGKPLGHGDRQPLCPSVIQLLSTQRTALFCYDTLATLLLWYYCYSNIPITKLILIQQPVNLLCSYWHSNTTPWQSWYNNPPFPILILVQQSAMLQYSF